MWGVSLLLLQMFPAVVVNGIAVLTWRQTVRFTGRPGMIFSVFLCPCKSHGVLIYVLKILRLQFGPS